MPQQMHASPWSRAGPVDSGSTTCCVGVPVVPLSVPVGHPRKCHNRWHPPLHGLGPPSESEQLLVPTARQPDHRGQLRPHLAVLANVLRGDLPRNQQ